MIINCFLYNHNRRKFIPKFLLHPNPKLKMQNPTQKSAPITFEIQEELLSKLKNYQKLTKANSVSEVIRYSLNAFNFNAFKHNPIQQKQISVRLPENLKSRLTVFSTKKRVSIGELLRVAIENLCLHSPKPQTKKVMAISTIKKVVKKAAKKAAGVKKAVKKTPAKKAVKKTAAKKAVKKTVKKAAKKATARKS